MRCAFSASRRDSTCAGSMTMAPSSPILYSRAWGESEKARAAGKVVWVERENFRFQARPPQTSLTRSPHFVCVSTCGFETDVGTATAGSGTRLVKDQDNCGSEREGAGSICFVHDT